MRTRFTDNWQFLKLPLHTDYAAARSRAAEFVPVEVPHDWAISDVSDFYADADGWYRKLFSCAKQEGCCYLLRFEGVYMDCEVYVNGAKRMEWKYGYSTFDVDITEALISGENELMVGVHYQNPNSRWYSGAGIYRNVWLSELPAEHFAPDGIYIRAREEETGWRVRVSAEVECSPGAKPSSAESGKEKSASADDTVRYRIGDMEQTVPVKFAQAGAGVAEAEFFLSDVRVWSVEQPNLYELTAELCRGDKVLQTETQVFGCRTFAVDPDDGFLLNHRKLKLNGVCMHHDMGALGAAVHKDAIRRQLRIMKRMGVNAIRTSHNMPAVELMELADELGILILSEAFDMWERPKTSYDYARFFPEWYARDVRSWVRRDRNHPSLVFWSIGNEIYDMHEGPRGQEITRMLMEAVYRHDPEKNGLVTFGSNYMPWENAQKCADIVKIAGYNYSEKYYDEHHEKYKDWVIFGSETSSTVQSRGVYHFPLAQPVLADVDEQCSSLGNSTTSWGAKSSEACVIAERDHAFSMGQFLWTGFDYIGEPTPYHTKNSYFGQVDTAGFEKDSFYIYQAAWTKEPMVHLFPYWNFNEGQTIDVRVATNAPRVELFLNGRSLGVQKLDHAHGMRLTADYQVPYEKGELTAVVFDESGRELKRESRHSFSDPAALVLRCTDADEQAVGHRDENGAFVLESGQKQLYFLEIGMADADGYPVENANGRVRVRVSGEGRLLGLDNGDSTDNESYQSDNRLLFSGKLLAILEASGRPGGMQVWVEPVKEEVCRVREIELIRSGGRALDREQPESEVAVRVLPKEAAGQRLVFEMIEKSGIPSNRAALEELPVSDEDRAAGIAARLRVTAKGDGAFRLRATADNGAKQVKTLSVLDYEASGLGAALIDPYRFVSGGLFNDAIGDVGNGNENGVATARDGRTAVGFRGVDFGEAGSDRLTLPIFELGGERCEIDLWLGRPDEAGSRKLDTLVYHRPSVWNTYQEESYRLPERLRGVCDLYFELHQKIHLKGFVFERCPKAYEKLMATENQNMYGDSFTVAEDGIMDIGNNVMIDFEDMDFGDEGCGSLVICGRTKNPKNTIHVRFSDGEQELREVVEFARAEDFTEQAFAIGPVCGMQKVSFVFMPGSQFDFQWFQFKKEGTGK